MRRCRSFLSVFEVLLTIVSGCGILDQAPTVCTSDFRFGLSVYVRDSVTGIFAASGAQLLTEVNGIVVDSGNRYPNTYPPNQRALDSLPLWGAGERAGVFRVTIRKPGYADWIRTGVRVTEDECHVRRTTLTARIQSH